MTPYLKDRLRDLTRYFKWRKRGDTWHVTFGQDNTKYVLYRDQLGWNLRKGSKSGNFLSLDSPGTNNTLPDDVDAIEAKEAALFSLWRDAAFEAYNRIVEESYTKDNEDPWIQAYYSALDNAGDTADENGWEPHSVEEVDVFLSSFRSALDDLGIQD